MLTIGQLADYVGVTQRAIRHYHSLGLLPEPERTASGYRSYTAQDVVELQRIKVLSDAGVPLARVRELSEAGPDAVRAAVAEVDAELRRRIRELQATRRSLATLASGGDPFLSPRLVAMHEELRAMGISELTLSANRDGWVLVQVLYPDLVEPWLDVNLAMLADPDYAELYLQTDQAHQWDPDDPRIEDLARRTVEWVLSRPSVQDSAWGDDPTAYRMVTQYQIELSPGWTRLMSRIQDLMTQALAE